MTKPTTRLARYPLLLEAVLKHTPDDSPDKVALPKAVAIVREFLKAVNAETGKAENRFNLLQLSEQLTFRPGEHVVCAQMLLLTIRDTISEMARIILGPAVTRRRPRAHLQGLLEETRRWPERERGAYGVLV